MAPLLFDVFGRRVVVERQSGAWVAFDQQGEGKRRPARGLHIPADLEAAEVARYLADLCHESASPTVPDVRQLSSAGTVVFDFDSTLIVAESLEVLVEPRLAADPLLRAEFEAITRQGMEGSRSFAESLSARLGLARPTRVDVDAFAERLPALWTPGFPDLVHELQWRGVDVWLTSGALVDCLNPAAAALGIPEERVRGVRTLWDEHGTLLGPDPADPFSRSKVEGIRESGLRWEAPAVVVGDGATDRAVVEAGLADTFVAYTGNVRREVVTRGTRFTASGVKELREHLERLVP